MTRNSKFEVVQGLDDICTEQKMLSEIRKKTVHTILGLQSFLAVLQ